MAYSWSKQIKFPTTRNNEDLNPGEHTLVYHQVPVNWFSDTNLENLQYSGTKLVLPQSQGKLDDVLVPRGQDSPSFSVVNPRVGNKLHQKGIGTLSLVDSSGYIVTHGSPNATNNTGRLTFSIHTESQIPSLSATYKLRLPSGELRHWRLIFHGNDGMTGIKIHNPESLKTNGLYQDIFPFPIPASQRKAALEKRLFGVTLKFRASTGDPGKRWHNSITVMHDKHNADGSDRWTSHTDMVNDCNRHIQAQMLGREDYLTGFDQSVFRIFNDMELEVTCLREMKEFDEGHMNRFNAELEYWEKVMNLAIQHKPFWFYTMQPDFRHVSGHHFDNWKDLEASPPVPFWCVREWKAVVDRHGLKELMPLAWSAIVQDPTDRGQETMMPHADLDNFLDELSRVRRTAHQTVIAQASFKGSNSDLKKRLAKVQMHDETWPRRQHYKPLAAQQIIVNSTQASGSSTLGAWRKQEKSGEKSVGSPAAQGQGLAEQPVASDWESSSPTFDFFELDEQVNRPLGTPRPAAQGQELAEQAVAPVTEPRPQANLVESGEMSVECSAAQELDLSGQELAEQAIASGPERRSQANPAGGPNQASIEDQIQELRTQIAELRTQNAELTTQIAELRAMMESRGSAHPYAGSSSAEAATKSAPKAQDSQQGGKPTLWRPDQRQYRDIRRD